ncbi:unnamed protein product [Penicillium salamii]|uniref:IQ calmodulin-binding motif protein n=1 Tax=Penicillium salamii TaxID=1612424 RepID=A0A9W4JYU4_9EURO|nr:unnamed protein product [Penicillium salamii]CAG8204615.1 unnamed protein product [Penicillium salamii]CAG8211783.1 unnamed protein product [Penicillium salamii]CAG8219564.1 unnamed protein product [Penicillium salamii]CAG8257712.1 unnamed protein product [Penicillium salamii]
MTRVAGPETLPSDVIESAARTVQAIREAQWQQLHRPPEPEDVSKTERSNQARRNWQRAVSVAKRAGGDDDRLTGPSSSTETRPENHTEIASGTQAKMMDVQYFLEMVDLKHRHGSNLRAYHTFWRNSSSSQNFFYWLDHGDGKSVEVAQCPRDRLEREQVRYLTRDERMNYLVTVDEAGLFRWAKNNEPVWTSTAKFKDSLRGVVPIDENVPQFRGNSPTFESESMGALSLSSSSSSSSFSSGQSMGSVLSNEQDKPFTDEEYKAAKIMKKVVHASPSAAVRRLLGKSPKKEDMWIFVSCHGSSVVGYKLNHFQVADTSFRLYIGIKKSGAFQHSSFLRGARIAAAGMIKIKHGQLRSLAPMRYVMSLYNDVSSIPGITGQSKLTKPRSGHYRPPAANFRAFHHALQQQGVDMSHVSMSKSYIMLAGIQGYTKTKRKVRAAHEKVDDTKHKLHKPPE